MSQKLIAVAFIGGIAAGVVAMAASELGNASAQAASPVGPYQLVAYRGSAGDVAWRLNAVSGEVVFCWNAGNWGCVKAPVPNSN